MRHVIWCALAIGIAGCGGGSTTSSDEEGLATDDTGGGEMGVDTGGGEEGGEGGAAQTPSGPGQLHVVNRVGGQDAHGHVRVLNSSGTVVAEGDSGETFTVQSGTYTLSGQITDEDELIDRPTREGGDSVTVAAGETTNASVDFPVSRVRIRVTRGGRAIARWTMQVRPVDNESAEPIELRPQQQHVPITPGRYRALIRMGSTEVTVDEVIFQGGATMDVPVNLGAGG